ncbi:MAG: hypothetical protein LBG44_03390, partial [Gemmatimonadota bacterium]|nr:hypothetical protein [Gemmatimonadota bacterium]
MNYTRKIIGAVVVASCMATVGHAQEGLLPLAPIPPSGGIVAPYFDGYYTNPDGTYTFSFGYMNRNTEGTIDIPLGPDNFIEPAQYNGMQPTHFETMNRGGFNGRRERGAFSVTVPANFTGDVWWTLRTNGETTRVPGRTGSVAYQLSHTPQAAGSLPPLLRVEKNAPLVFGRGPTAMTMLRTKVGQPLTLWVDAQDRGDREEKFQVNATWIVHQGVAPVTFAPATIRSPSAPGGELTTQATFSQPGEYVIRVRVDNFTSSDSSFADQCCWSNGFYKVTV